MPPVNASSSQTPEARGSRPTTRTGLFPACRPSTVTAARPSALRELGGKLGARDPADAVGSEQPRHRAAPYRCRGRRLPTARCSDQVVAGGNPDRPVGCHGDAVGVQRAGDLGFVDDPAVRVHVEHRCGRRGVRGCRRKPGRDRSSRWSAPCRRGAGRPSRGLSTRRHARVPRGPRATPTTCRRRRSRCCAV